MVVLRVAFQGGTLKEFAELYLSDLSPAGIFVRSDQPLPVGTRLRMDFRLEQDEPLLEGQAVVVWVTEGSHTPELASGMELRFEALLPESEQRFEWLRLYKRGRSGGKPSQPRAGLVSPPVQTSADARTTTPYVRAELLPDSPATSSDGPIATPAPDEALPTGRFRALTIPARPGAEARDSDPGSLFNAVASSTPSGLRLDRPASPSSRDTHDLPGPATRRPWATLAIGLGLVAVLAGYVGWWKWRADAGPRAAPPALRLLRLSSEPPAADVYVDGIPTGRAPLEIPVRPHSRITVRHQHFEPVSIDLSGTTGWQREGPVAVLVLRVQLRASSPGSSKSVPRAAGR